MERCTGCHRRHQNALLQLLITEERERQSAQSAGTQTHRHFLPRGDRAESLQQRQPCSRPAPTNRASTHNRSVINGAHLCSERERVSRTERQTEVLLEEMCRYWLLPLSPLLWSFKGLPIDAIYWQWSSASANQPAYYCQSMRKKQCTNTAKKKPTIDDSTELNCALGATAWHCHCISFRPLCALAVSSSIAKVAAELCPLRLAMVVVPFFSLCLTSFGSDGQK